MNYSPALCNADIEDSIHTIHALINDDICITLSMQKPLQISTSVKTPESAMIPMQSATTLRDPFLANAWKGSTMTLITLAKVHVRMYM